MCASGPDSAVLIAALKAAIGAPVQVVQEATPPSVRLRGCQDSLASHRAKKDKLMAELSTLTQRVDRVCGLLPRVE
eukprot:12914056-Prorocentrum_lima.AAC.1